MHALGAGGRALSARARARALCSTASARAARGSRLSSLQDTLDAEDSLAVSQPASPRRRGRRVGRQRKGEPPKPKWLRFTPPSGEAKQNYERLRDTVGELGLATVCQEARWCVASRAQ